MTKRNNTNIYDGFFKELLDRLPEQNIIELINQLFNRDYSLNSEVSKLSTESHIDGEERRSDMMIKIGGDMYHIELQSNSDKSMAFRVFEYSFRAAMQHGKIDNTDYLELNFPKSIVIYLRDKQKDKHDLKIKLKLPDGQMVDFNIPTKRINDYSSSELLDKSLFMLAPFYPMVYEEKINQKETQKKLLAEAQEIHKWFKSKAEKGKISLQFADLAINAMQEITEEILSKSELNRKEVDEFMETIGKKYFLEPLNWEAAGIAKGLEKGIAEGRRKGKAEGRTEGKAEVVINMTAKGKSIIDIIDATDFSEERILSIQKNNADLIAKRKLETQNAKNTVPQKKNPPLMR